MQHKAVLFDFDGTLVDTEWAIYRTWLETFQNFGQDLPIEVYVQCIGSDFDTWSPKIHLEELTGQKFDWESMDQLRNEKIRASLREQGAIEGAQGVLDVLRDQVRLAVVSSSSHDWVDGWLARLELDTYFEQTTCRGDAPRIKPAPDLYLQSAKTLNLRPKDCLVIEDSVNGVQAAKRAGMQVYAIPNQITIVSDFSEADGVFGTLDELRNALYLELAL